MLEEYIKKNSNFVTIADGQTETFTITGYNEVQSSFGNPTIAYQVKVSGEDKIFNTSSVKFARAVLALPNKGIGVKVEVKREGEGTKTTYVITPITAISDPQGTPF